MQLDLTNNFITIRDWLRFAVSQFEKNQVFFGHGTDNSYDEAVWLIMGGLHLPLASLDKFLDAKLSKAECKHPSDLVEQRIFKRIPTAYLLHEAWLFDYKFYVDERVIVPRSFIAELLLEQLSPWVENPEIIGSAADLCTGSGCLGILLAHAFPNSAIDIIDISKIESGKMTIESIDFNLFDLVEETTKVFMIQAATKGISFNTYISPLLPKTISSDMVRIKQVMINLISNAMKFTEIGQVEIHVKPVEGIVGLWIEFIVSDTGIGLSPTKVETLFEAFNQLDSSISRRFGGSGLGLSICKGIIDGMGGDIWAESEVGKGSQFHFKVPYVEAELGTE